MITNYEVFTPMSNTDEDDPGPVRGVPPPEYKTVKDYDPITGPLAIVTRHYAATPGARERITARWGDKQVTTVYLKDYPAFANHQRAAMLLGVKHGLMGEWLAARRNFYSWVFVEESDAKRTNLTPPWNRR